MDLTASIQYWFFTIFMQFVPLNETEVGTTFKYTIKQELPPMVITVNDVVFEDMENMRWKFSIAYDSDDFASKHQATLAHSPKHLLHFTEYTENGVSLLEKNRIVRLPKRGYGLIVSTDDTYILKPKTSYETEIETSEGSVTCNKQAYESADGMKVDVFHDELFGLIRVSFKFPGSTEWIDIVREK